MLPIETRIHRTQRLLSMLERDAPLLARRVSELTPEHQESARSHIAELTARTRAELERLIDKRIVWHPGDPPEPAD